MRIEKNNNIPEITQITNEFEYRSFVCSLDEKFDFKSLEEILKCFSLYIAFYDRAISSFFFTKAIFEKYPIESMNNKDFKQLVYLSIESFNYNIDMNIEIEHVPDYKARLYKLFEICKSDIKFFETFKELANLFKLETDYFVLFCSLLDEYNQET